MFDKILTESAKLRVLHGFMGYVVHLDALVRGWRDSKCCVAAIGCVSLQNFDVCQ